MNSPVTDVDTPTVVQRPALRVEVVSDYEALLRLEPRWNALTEQAGIDHPFLSHEWIRTWWQCFGADKQMRIVIVKAGADIIAIAPFMQTTARVYGIPVRRLEFICNDHTPRFDFILGREPEAACRAIWLWLRSRQAEWDMLQLRQLPAGSYALVALQALAQADAFLVGTAAAEESPYVPFTGGWENFTQRLSRNHRSKVRKGLNRLTREGAVALEVVAEGAAVAGAVDEGMRIEALAWKESAGTAIRSQPAVRQFYERFAECAASAGLLRLVFLTLGGKRIAFAYALGYHNKLYVLKAGYDPAFAYYSPYNVLCYLVFQDGFARGLDEYEFLGGNEPWKLDWTEFTRAHFWLHVFPNRWRTRLLHALKCRLVPRLQQNAFYLKLRDACVGATRRRTAPNQNRDKEEG